MFGSLTLWISLQTLEKHSDGWIKVKESPGNLDQDNVLFYQPLFILQYLHQDSSVLQQNWCLFLGSGIITHFLVHYSLFYIFFCSLWPFPRTALPSFNFPLDSFFKTLLKGSIDDHCNPTSSLFDMQHLLLAFDLAHFSYSILFLSVFSYFSHALQHPTHCYKPSSHHPKPCIYTASWNQEVFSTTLVQLTLPYSTATIIVLPTMFLMIGKPHLVSFGTFMGLLLVVHWTNFWRKAVVKHLSSFNRNHKAKSIVCLLFHHILWYITGMSRI